MHCVCLCMQRVGLCVLVILHVRLYVLLMCMCVNAYVCLGMCGCLGVSLPHCDADFSKTQSRQLEGGLLLSHFPKEPSPPHLPTSHKREAAAKGD